MSIVVICISTLNRVPANSFRRVRMYATSWTALQSRIEPNDSHQYYAIKNLIIN